MSLKFLFIVKPVKILYTFLFIYNKILDVIYTFINIVFKNKKMRQGQHSTKIAIYLISNINFTLTECLSLCQVLEILGINTELEEH